MNKNNNNQFVIRTPEQTDAMAWGELWNQYLTFYKAIDHSEDLTLLLWQRILDETHPIHCLVVEDKSSKKLLGFVHFSPQVTTWQKEYECYLEDLFVTDELRGKSIGEQLINEVVAQSKRNGWKEVYWQTQYDNAPARGLYDKITGGTNGYVIYRIEADK